MQPLAYNRELAAREPGLPEYPGADPERLPLEVAEPSAVAAIACHLPVVVASQAERERLREKLVDGEIDVELQTRLIQFKQRRIDISFSISSVVASGSQYLASA